MYLPRAFAETDLAALDRLAAADSFISLITVHDGLISGDVRGPHFFRSDKPLASDPRLGAPNMAVAQVGAGLANQLTSQAQ